MTAPPRSPQKGVTLVMVALWMGIALAALMVLDIGNLFWQKRELQKIADLSALAGAVKPLDGACTSASSSNAKLIAEANGMRVADTFVAKHGQWKPAVGVPLEQFFAESAASTSNACHVEIQRNVSYFFILSASGNQSRWIGAKATALVSGEPMATVLIRSTLASLNGGVLNTLLSAVLGSQINLTAASWQGIAKLNVNLLKVFDSLLELNTELGSYEQLLKSKLKVGDLLTAMVTAVEPGRFATADVAALRQLASVNFGNVEVRLADLIKLENVSPSAALNLGVSALELVQGALQFAAKDKVLSLNMNILGLLKVKLKVIEPAQMAIIGNPNNENIVIEARTAQVRLWVALGTSTSPAADVLKSVGDLVVGVLKALLGILINIELLPNFKNLSDIKLDFLVDVARGYARVEGPTCEASSPDLSVHVEKAVADVYIGQIAGNNLAERESKAFGAEIPVVKPLVILEADRRICILLICGTDHGFYGNITIGGHLKGISEKETIKFSNAQLNKFESIENNEDERKYYSVLKNNLSSISKLLIGVNLIEVNLQGGVDSQQRFSIVDSLLKNVLTPLLSILDPLAPLLDGLLNALGIQLNEIEVAPYLQCGGRSELVY